MAIGLATKKDRLWRSFFEIRLSQLYAFLSSYCNCILNNSSSTFTTLSTSAVVLYLLNEKRMVLQSLFFCNAFITCEPLFSPLLQALPPDTQIPAISSSSNNDSPLGVLGKQTLSTVYNEFSGLLKLTPGHSIH